jgi:hypothetical protein
MKDKLKATDPYQLLDLMDNDRDGFLNRSEFAELLYNLDILD